jgi:hypothetical protein
MTKVLKAERGLWTRLNPYCSKLCICGQLLICLLLRLVIMIFYFFFATSS